MKPTIPFADFAKVEIRVGEVLEATVPEGSKKLIRQRVNFGEEIGERVIFSGIKQWYEAEALVGKKLPYVINIPERVMPFSKQNEAGEMVPEKSQGMLLAVVAHDEEGEQKAVLLQPENSVLAGDQVL